MNSTSRDRASGLRKLHRILMTLAAIVVVLWPYMFSVASTGTTFTLSNRTRYYLHANVNNKRSSTLPPEARSL